ncbi:MAG: hypothetical protein K2G90_01220 [Muribaculaceae bacterium]|nr:hypothetical protein [Muribaculaceae bacterium]
MEYERYYDLRDDCKSEYRYGYWCEDWFDNWFENRAANWSVNRMTIHLIYLTVKLTITLVLHKTKSANPDNGLTNYSLPSSEVFKHSQKGTIGVFTTPLFRA